MIPIPTPHKLPWTAYRDGNDIVIPNAIVTCFGGIHDPQDDGSTASGVSTKNPNVLGCAIPRNYTNQKQSPATYKALNGSPIPEHIPFKTEVEFLDKHTGLRITVPFIDLGPNLNTGHAGDLTIAAAKTFNSHATATNFTATLDIRIIGGAKYL